MPISEILREKREEILRIATKHGARNLRIFGSYARGEEHPDSDIDMLVDMEQDRSLLDIIAIKHDLEDLIQRKVDVVTVNSISPYLKESILQSAVAL
ncbi:MAG: nucleotidyltransferase family protein [Deltaproteobacteria bacterium]|nr:nucleotidyltransferase family protein [Deltaproteobacteria bacterium]